jgi:ribosomal protein S6
MAESIHQTEVKEYEISAISTSETVLADVRAALEKEQAVVTEEGKAVALRLAYAIRKQTSGFFSFIKFSAHPETIAAIEKRVNALPHILRLLIVTPPPAHASENERRRERTGTGQKPASPETPQLTNEALEQKIEEILK